VIPDFNGFSVGKRHCLRDSLNVALCDERLRRTTDVAGGVDWKCSVHRHGCLLRGLSWRLVVRRAVGDINPTQADENAGQDHDRHDNYKFHGLAKHSVALRRPVRDAW
jgi:hypothetical protein